MKIFSQEQVSARKSHENIGLSIKSKRKIGLPDLYLVSLDAHFVVFMLFDKLK